MWHPLVMWAQLQHLIARLFQALLQVQLMAGLEPLPPRAEHLQLGALMRPEALLAWSCLLPLSQPSPAASAPNTRLSCNDDYAASASKCCDVSANACLLSAR